MSNKIVKLISFSRPEIAVFASGVSSMGLEILAGRMIAPEFGSSIYTWGTIIGVFLTALALGYQRGGQKSSENINYKQLGILLLASTGYIAIIIFTYEEILSLSRLLRAPTRFASFIPVIVLFAPQTYLLGFISPYAAQLSERTTKGDAAGHIYALGTFGSIIGSFATTFLLIPTFSINNIGIILGGVLILAAIYVLYPSISNKNIIFIFIICVGLISTTVIPPLGSSTSSKTLYQTQTPYQELEITQDGDVRTLYLGDLQHSSMDVTQPDKHVYNYTKNFYIPFLMNENISDVLFIGGGGFTGPKMFADDPNVSVDVVELDPDVVSASKRYFNVSESDNLTIHVEDGRSYLESTDKKYDLIVLDAYKKDAVPFHLTTQEFMQLTHDRLNENGIVLSNIISGKNGAKAKFYRSEYKTMDTVYSEMYSFPTSDTSKVQNIILVGSKSNKEISKREMIKKNSNKNMETNLSYNLQFYTTNVDTENSIILRDEKAPTARLTSPMIGLKYNIEESNPYKSQNKNISS